MNAVWMRPFWAIILGLLVACDGPDVPPAETEASSLIETELSLEDAKAIYDYAYPLVIMKISQDLMLTVPIRPRTTPNHFIHFKRLAQPEQRAVVLGNRNTLYSVGWLDLSEGPVVFEIPDMGDRYYVMPLLDAWTNTFKSLGSRTTGQGAQKYLIANANFSGTIPEEHTLITSPTNMVWITGRIQADSAEDAKRVAGLQDKYTLMTLQEYLGGEDPFSDFEPKYTFGKVRLPVPYSLQMDAAEFYNTFLEMRAMNAVPEADAKMTALMQVAGIDVGTSQKFSDLAPSIQARLTEGLKEKQEVYTKAFYDGAQQTEPWIFNIDSEMGNWGTDYTRRAYWAMWGLGTNISPDAVYGVTQLDENLVALNGANTYRLHFGPDTLPPTRAFWSVTNYDAEGYLERNPMDRYSLGSNHDLFYNPDGSLDIYLGHSKPTGDAINWVPAPEEDFKTLLRIYWPEPSVLNGNWSLPVVQKIGE